MFGLDRPGEIHPGSKDNLSIVVILCSFCCPWREADSPKMQFILRKTLKTGHWCLVGPVPKLGLWSKSWVTGQAPGVLSEVTVATL